MGRGCTTELSWHRSPSPSSRGVFRRGKPKVLGKESMPREDTEEKGKFSELLRTWGRITKLHGCTVRALTRDRDSEEESISVNE